jgi:AcrR family transcriptional regulator
MKVRGRPQSINDEVILDAALKAFAEKGYKSVSLRTLSVQLGLSHSAIGQRFGSKKNLFECAVTAGFEQFFSEIAAEQAKATKPLSGLEELRSAIHAFLVVSSNHPEMGRLLSTEGVETSERMSFFEKTVLTPQLGQLAELIKKLIEQDLIYPVSVRGLFFLIGHGAEAPFTLTAFSASFDQFDGKLNNAEHITMMTDLLMRGITK